MNIVKAAQRISIRDYSNYDPEKCHDGGCYAVGMDFYRHPSGWECKRFTSGDYCPYCGSFECPGDCEDARITEEERLNDKEVEQEVANAYESGYEVRWYTER